MYTNAKQVQDIIEGLRKDAKVQILDKKYETMQKMFGPQQALPSFGAEGAKGGVNGAQPPAGEAPPPSAAPAPAEGAAPAPAAPAAPAKQ